MTCPFCEQGRVYTVRLVALEQTGDLCEECDALWLDRAAIAAASYVDFGAYMRSHGRPGLWTEVEFVANETSVP